MGIEEHVGITDQVFAELVDMTPEPVKPEPVAPATPAEPTPTDEARDATIEHTGADPPPRGYRSFMDFRLPLYEPHPQSQFAFASSSGRV